MSTDTRLAYRGRDCPGCGTPILNNHRCQAGPPAPMPPDFRAQVATHRALEQGRKTAEKTGQLPLPFGDQSP